MTQKKRELNRSRSPEVFGKTRIQRNKLSPRHSAGIFILILLYSFSSPNFPEIKNVVKNAL